MELYDCKSILISCTVLGAWYRSALRATRTLHTVQRRCFRPEVFNDSLFLSHVLSKCCQKPNYLSSFLDSVLTPSPE